MDARALRLLTLVLPLLYVDTITAIFATYTVTWELPYPPSVLHKLSERPLLGEPAIVMFYAMYWAIETQTMHWLVSILPAPSAAMVLAIMSSRHIARRLVEPIPAHIIASTPQVGFCRICRTTLLAKWVLHNESGSLDSTKRFRHHRTSSSLRSSVAAGCRICTTIWHHLSQSKPDLSIALAWHDTTTFELASRRIIIHFKNKSYICQFRVMSTTKDIAQSALPQKKLSDHTGSQATLDQAK